MLVLVTGDVLFICWALSFFSFFSSGLGSASKGPNLPKIVIFTLRTQRI